jgi:hypothetical protein
VLFRDDMLDVMGELTILLAQAAIFATLVSPPSDEVARPLIHPLQGVRIQSVPGFEFED